MQNGLAAHLTRWKAWYAIFAVPALIIGSTVAVLGGLAGSQGARETLSSLLMPVQFVAIVALALGAIALVTRKLPTVEDLGLRRGLSGRDAIIVLVVFAVTHLLFWLLAFVPGQDTGSATEIFAEMNLDGPLLPAVMGVIASVIFAPVCEELLYRGAVLRPIHDHLARGGRAGLGAVLGILVSAVMFAFPHLGGSLTGVEAFSYLLTGVAFGAVYVLTGSMTAAMMTHVLQSWAAFGQVLVFGRGDAAVSPLIWILVLGCPLWVYLCARGLRAVLPHDRPGAATAGGDGAAAGGGPTAGGGSVPGRR